MRFQLQTDKNPFQFHIIYVGMNPLKKDAATGTRVEKPWSQIESC
jgi:hypothetical protein